MCLRGVHNTANGCRWICVEIVTANWNGIRGKMTATTVVCAAFRVDSVRAWIVQYYFYFFPTRFYCCMYYAPCRDKTLNKSQRMPPMHTWFYSNLKFSISYYMYCTRLHKILFSFSFSIVFCCFGSGSALAQRHQDIEREKIEKKMPEIIVRREYMKLDYVGNHIQNEWEKFNTVIFRFETSTRIQTEGRFPQWT